MKRIDLTGNQYGRLIVLGDIENKMLEYSELKQAVDNGFIQGDKVMIVRRDGKIFDYVLPGEPVRPCPKFVQNVQKMLGKDKNGIL